MKLRKIGVILFACVLVASASQSIVSHAANVEDINVENSNDPSTASITAQFVCTGDNVRLRTGPGTNYSIIMEMFRGNSGLVHKYSGNWAYVTVTNYQGNTTGPKTGWVSVDYIELREP